MAEVPKESRLAAVVVVVGGFASQTYTHREREAVVGCVGRGGEERETKEKHREEKDEEKTV